jgi:hypothetical protein
MIFKLQHGMVCQTSFLEEYISLFSKNGGLELRDSNSLFIQGVKSNVKRYYIPLLQNKETDT